MEEGAFDFKYAVVCSKIARRGLFARWSVLARTLAPLAGAYLYGFHNPPKNQFCCPQSTWSFLCERGRDRDDIIVRAS
jgi:hypothetical protein